MARSVATAVRGGVRFAYEEASHGARFELVLAQYGNRVHQGQFVTPGAVAAHIEAHHHG